MPKDLTVTVHNDKFTYEPTDKKVHHKSMVRFELAKERTSAELTFDLPSHFDLDRDAMTLQPHLLGQGVFVSVNCPLGKSTFSTSMIGPRDDGGEGTMTGDVEVVPDPNEEKDSQQKKQALPRRGGS
jgi:hypothetical protein